MEFDHWHEPMFTVQILMACLMGFLVNYSTMLCTMYNSALTTSIVGVIKVRNHRPVKLPYSHKKHTAA